MEENDKISELRTRIEALEKTHKIFLWILYLLFAINFIFSYSKTFYGSLLSIFDSQGYTRGTFNKNGIELFHNSKIRLYEFDNDENKFSTDGKYGALSEITPKGIKFYNEKRVLLSEFHSNGFDFYDAKGALRISLKSTPFYSFSSSLQFYNQNGDLSGEFFLDKDGLSHLLIWDKDKKQHGFPSEFKFD